LKRETERLTCRLEYIGSQNVIIRETRSKQGPDALDGERRVALGAIGYFHDLRRHSLSLEPDGRIIVLQKPQECVPHEPVELSRAILQLEGSCRNPI
jgi:hypothetical protein